MSLRTVVGLAAAFVAVGACGTPGGSEGGPSSGPPLSEFAFDVEVTARAVENVDACVVDALCFLRLEFSDTTVTAMYGTGERPPPCRITVEVSDRAFAVTEGETVTLVLMRCGSDRPAIARFAGG